MNDSRRQKASLGTTSCHFCRSRKLKCSRTQPCTNCVDRRIECSPYAPEEHTGAAHVDTSSTTSTENCTSGDRASRKRGALDAPSHEPRKIAPKPEAEVPDFADDVLRLDRINPQPTRDHVGIRRLGIMSVYSILDFTTPPIEAAPGTDAGDLSTGAKWLPLQDQAKSFLEIYLSELTYLHHVIHPPLVAQHIDEFYMAINQRTSVDCNHVALILSILAATMYMWIERDNDLSVSLTESEAVGLSRYWKDIALEMLLSPQQDLGKSVETVQAMIVLAPVVLNLEGSSPTYRHLLATAISAARELRLHRIDHPVGAPDGDNDIRVELGRRVWWYLAANEWIFSRYSGPHEGSYTIHPHHIATNKPKNVNDQDMIYGRPIVGHPLDHPTSMSYILQRIRLGEICRKITDRMPLAILIAKDVDYSFVLDFHRMLSDFSESLPPFMRFDSESANESQGLDLSRTALFIIQKFVVNSLLNALTCRLHLPYLSPKFNRPEHARSKTACLQAARTIIRLEKWIHGTGLAFASKRFKIAGAIHCLFMGVSVLVLDLCFSHDRTNKTFRQELMDACDVLVEAKKQSQHAEKVLELLQRILGSYEVSFPALERISRSDDTNIPTGPQALEGPFPAGGESVVSSGNIEQPQRTVIDSGVFSLGEDVWQTLTNGMQMDVGEWNSLLADFDLSAWA